MHLILQIALGILLGYLMIIYLPTIIALGIWAIIIAIAIVVIVLVAINLTVIGNGLFDVAVITLVIFSLLGSLAILGYISYFFPRIAKLLRLGKRPVLGNEKTKFLQQKELIFDYMAAGSRLGLLLLFTALIIALINAFISKGMN